MTSVMNNAKIIQNCYVVRDLEEACARMNKLYGIGPFLGGGESVLADHIYRGKEEEPIKILGVFGQSGDLNIELVQLLSDTPSAFHDMYPDGGEGFHHIAAFCEDFDKERDAFVAAGYEVASQFEAVGKTFCYIDAVDTLGHMIELYPEHPIVRQMYQQTIDAAANWDGKDLIIPWESLDSSIGTAVGQ